MKSQLFATLILFFMLFNKVFPQYGRFNQPLKTLKIGGLFDEESEKTQMVFEYAVKYVNLQRNQSFPQIEAIPHQVMHGNILNTSQAVCSMIENKVIGIIGPSSPETAVHVRSLCDTKEIPLIETLNDGTSRHTINLHPTPEDLGMVYLDMINAWEWDGFTILFEDAAWLRMVEYILRNYKRKQPISLRQLDLTSDGNYREQLKKVKSSEYTNIVLCSSIEALPDILKQAQQVGLMTAQHQFIITSLDLHTIDLEPFKHGGTNITGFRMVSPKTIFVNRTTEFFKQQFFKDKTMEQKASRGYGPSEEEEIEFPEELTAEKISLKTALTFDAVLLFHHVMTQHQDMVVDGIKCGDRKSTFTNGTSIFNSMKTHQTFKGLSGEIQFGQLGNRENFKLEVLELTSEGLKQIATWDSINKIQTIKKQDFDGDSIDPKNIRNKTLTVVTGIQAPYAMLKESVDPLIGNNRYEGFAIELIEKLAEALDFTPIFIIEEKNTVGTKIDPSNKTSEWSGMIGKLRSGVADLAITDLTITAEREAAIDFTMPFMTLGISILYQRPKKEDPKLFSFLDPFSQEVWMYLFGSFFLVSTLLFILGRLSPAEWDNPFPCIEEPEVLINQLSFKNSMWFSVGSMLQQGSDIAPKAPSTRIIASMWWFFTLIMVSSYTANLAAFLTIENPVSLVNSIEDLKGENNKAPFGAKKVGSTANFFRDSTNEEYREMFKKMEKEGNLQNDNDAGVLRAETEKFAYFMESSTIEYTIERHCNVVQYGGLLDEKGYGIGMKKGSPFRGILSETVLQLQESGEISRLRTKWWKEKRGGGACSSADDGGQNNPLDIRNVGGVFVVVCGGCFLALFIGVFQWIRTTLKYSRSSNVPFITAMKDELKFFIKFRTHVKAVPGRKNSSQHSDSANRSCSRSRSTNNINKDSIGFRMSLKNLHKIPRDESFDDL